MSLREIRLGLKSIEASREICGDQVRLPMLKPQKVWMNPDQNSFDRIVSSMNPKSIVELNRVIQARLKLILNSYWGNWRDFGFRIGSSGTCLILN